MLKDFTIEKFDIVIQAGQSNAQGYGFGPTDDPYQPDERVWYLNQDGTISIAAEKVINNGIQSSFALSFAREYLKAGKLSEGRKILILCTAAGGTGFLDGRWGLSGDCYLRMIEMIRTAVALSPENRLVALLWHQGENDVTRGASFELHYQNLFTLLQTVRETFHVPDLPFIAGDLVHRWKYFSENKDACIPVVDAIRAVCCDCGHGGFVETDGLNSNAQEQMEHPLGWPSDDIHFSRRALYELGIRYFDKFIALCGRDSQ